MKQYEKSLALRVRVLREELAACRTDAQRKCVQESLDAAMKCLGAAHKGRAA